MEEKVPHNKNLACRQGVFADPLFGWTSWAIAPCGGQGSSESFAFLGPLSTTWGYRSTRSPKKWSSRNTSSTCQIHVPWTFSPKPSLGTLKILVFEENKNYISIMSAPMRQIYINIVAKIRSGDFLEFYRRFIGEREIEMGNWWTKKKSIIS